MTSLLGPAPALTDFTRLQADSTSRALLDTLPVGICYCDRVGAITLYNRKAAEYWGRSPEIGDESAQFCGAYRLRDLNGREIPKSESPMAFVLANGVAIRDERIIVEREDGTRVMGLLNIEPIRNSAGELIGAVNVFRDVPAQSTAPHAREPEAFGILDLLPAAVYATDTEGRITYYNEAAVEMWGVRPEIGKSDFCGSWKLFTTDGVPLPHDASPMAIALKEMRVVRGEEAIAERPDGSRIRFIPYPTPMFDEDGKLSGALNMLVDVRALRDAQFAESRLAAIVESSQDAIVAKTLDGIITNWNNAATELFGYEPEEVIGKHVTILIPEELHNEETVIIAKIRRGEKVRSYETVRRRKDGSLVDVSLTISPVRDASGAIVGASKIARNITERKRAEERRQLLLREMNHRVKNLFTLSGSLVSLSARMAETKDDLVLSVQERIGALARAHEMTMTRVATSGDPEPQGTTLHALIENILAPYQTMNGGGGGSRVSIEGCDVDVGGNALTSLALLMHEFATNAAKYGALSVPTGHIRVACVQSGENLLLTWTERGGPEVEETRDEGFGTMISKATVRGQLGGEIRREWNREGLTIRLTLATERLK